MCSSLDDEIVEMKYSTHAREADMILREVKKYVNDWPEEEWGPKNLKNICVMATTANQVILLYNTKMTRMINLHSYRNPFSWVDLKRNAINILRELKY